MCRMRAASSPSRPIFPLPTPHPNPPGAGMSCTGRIRAGQIAPRATRRGAGGPAGNCVRSRHTLPPLRRARLECARVRRRGGPAHNPAAEGARQARAPQGGLEWHGERRSAAAPPLGIGSHCARNSASRPEIELGGFAPVLSAIIESTGLTTAAIVVGVYAWWRGRHFGCEGDGEDDGGFGHRFLRGTGAGKPEFVGFAPVCSVRMHCRRFKSRAE